MKTVVSRTLSASVLVLVLASCSIQKMAFNSISDMMAPSIAQKSVTPNDPQNPMLALTGESDVKLVSQVMPVILKTYELMHLKNPAHRGLALMNGELYIMYANAFVQTPADELSDEFYMQKDQEYLRAKKFYRRGVDYICKFFDLAYSDFTRTFSATHNEEALAGLMAQMTKTDVEALFWLGAGALGAFSLDPMDPTLSDQVQGARVVLERAVELDPAYNNGALWEVLTSFYAAAPEGLGGGRQKAEHAYEQAVRYSKGKSPSVYLTYARSFCIPRQDAKGFDDAIAKALAIDPDANPENRLMTVLSQKQAQLLKTRKDEFFLEY